MSLQHLSIDAISEPELQRLVSDGVSESRVLEYKEALSIVTDDRKREFLSDVTALANTDGGDLLLGMRAENGVALELIGLKSLVADEAISRIENLLRDAVQPRLSGVKIHALALKNGNHALLLRTPRSFSAPHMVRHQGVTRFCGRNSNGKYDLDVHELRSAFLASETLSERLRAFRMDRINRLLSGSAPVPLGGRQLLVLHLLPVVGARADTRIATSSFNSLLGEKAPRPIAAHGWSSGFNFDGLIVSSSREENRYHAYVQITRSGFLESVDSSTLAPVPAQHRGGDPQRFISSVAWERRIIDALPSYLKALSGLNVPPPYVASISLLNVRGYSMYVGSGYSSTGPRAVDRDHLMTDEILIESVTESPGRLLRPLFDQVWNGCGWHGSLNYDASGNWTAHQ